MSMMPAFSPGPCTTRRLRVGRRFRCTRDDLYEQCSLHITLKMPSSVRVGSRPPSSCLIFSYSSGVRPCCRIVSGDKAGVKEVSVGGASIVAFWGALRIEAAVRRLEPDSRHSCYDSVDMKSIIVGTAGH